MTVPSCPPYGCPTMALSILSRSTVLSSLPIQDDPCCSEAHLALHDVTELICEIVTYLDWPSLMAFGRSSTRSRTIARFEVRGRIRFILSPFIPSGHFDAFFDLMARTSAGLVGSVARSLITLNAEFVMDQLGTEGEGKEIWIWPDDLNIAVRPRYRKEWEEFLSGMGYINWWNKRVAPHMRGTVHSIKSGGRTAVVSGRVLEDIAFARIISCKRTTLEMVLTSIFTVQTNMVTATSVYSFFPKLTINRLCIRNRGLLPGYPLPSMWHFAPTNEDMEVPCGSFCPTMGRLPTLEADSASFIWDVDHRSFTRPYDLPLRSKVLSLMRKFYPRCHNRHCVNYQPHPIHLTFGF